MDNVGFIVASDDEREYVDVDAEMGNDKVENV